MPSYVRYRGTGTVHLIMTKYGSDFLVDWGPRDTFLDPIFAQEHDARNFCSGTRYAHQFWPQCARSAASAGARLAAGPAAGQAARARARIQPKSLRASSQISEFRSCMHSVSWIHARAGGWVAAHAMEWARLPGRGGLLIKFEKSAARKLKCAHQLRSSGSARARGSEVTQF